MEINSNEELLSYKELVKIVAVCYEDNEVDDLMA